MEEIVRRHESRGELNYASVSKSNRSLLSAAIRHFGSWPVAVDAAGIDYSTVSRYQRWSSEAILERIKELNAEGADVSWHNVSTRLDPRLAAAAIKSSHFGSWRRAIEAAGLDYESIRRYRRWNNALVIDRVKNAHIGGQALNAKAMVASDLALVTAARRRFETWPCALDAAGFDHREIVERKPFRRRPSTAE